MTAAGVHDDAGAFPGFNEAFAGVRAVELDRQIVHVGHELDERGHVRFHFAEQGAFVDHFAARQVHYLGEGFDGGIERGNAVSRHAASGGGGIAHGGVGQVENGGGLVHKVLFAQAHDAGLGQVHLAEIVGVAIFLVMVGEGAGEDKGGVFQGGFRRAGGVAAAAGGGIGLRGQRGDVAVAGLEFGQIGGKIGRRIAGPDGLVVGAVGDGDAGANHVQLVLNA